MPEAYKRCVEKVSKQKGVKSAHAICTSTDAGHIRKFRKFEKKKTLEAKSKGKDLGRG